MASGPVRSAVLARGNAPATGNPIAFTCPTGYVTLVKHINLRPTSTNNYSPTIFAVSVDTAVTVTIASGTPDANAGLAWEGWFVLNAGDRIVLGMYGSTADYWIGGAILPYNFPLSPTSAQLPGESPPVPLPEPFPPMAP